MHSFTNNYSLLVNMEVTCVISHLTSIVFSDNLQIFWQTTPWFND